MHQKRFAAGISRSLCEHLQGMPPCYLRLYAALVASRPARRSTKYEAYLLLKQRWIQILCTYSIMRTKATYITTPIISEQ